MADWDLVQATANTCTQMHIVPFFRRVKGHQDGKMAYSNLPLEAQINVDANQESGSYCKMHCDDNSPVRLIPGTCANLTINANLLWIQTNYLDSINSPHLMAKIQEQNEWTPHDTSLVHWTALGRATCQCQAG